MGNHTKKRGPKQTAHGVDYKPLYRGNTNCETKERGDGVKDGSGRGFFSSLK